jgi:hypothetical protein
LIQKTSATALPDNDKKNRHEITMLNMMIFPAFRFQRNRCYDRAAI